jgi:effector-binding domain-containing protein
MSEFEIRAVPKQPTAAINLTCPTEQIGETMGQAFPKVFEAVAKAGLAPAGAPLARYFSFGSPVIEFECAIPVAVPFKGDGDVQPSEIGGGDAAFGLHVGPYDTIGQTWEAMMAWVTEQGCAPGGPGWEYYLTDPSEEPDPAKWVTEVYMPVA